MTSDIISNPYAGPGEWPPAWLDPWAKRAAAFGVVGGNPADRLRELADRILDVNRRVNLTSDRAPCVFWSRHVEDAVRAAGALEAALGRPVTGDAILDVGSGGGIPGLVWATLWPAARVGLIEATGKKARFLRE
ncbi:MAG: class I SAM-dependent methyltransferase, partial [bacterium]|nr:class I SAM-dependent methyltransferase [bacterium]